MFTRTFSALAGATFAAGMLALSTPVFAAEADQETAIIQIGDLNLNDEAGMARFERRVRAAARQVCGNVPARDPHMQKLTAACHSQVRMTAMSQAELAMKAKRPQGQLALRLD